MFCSNCGKKVPAETKFCPHCGADLRSKAATTATAARPTQTVTGQSWWQRLKAWVLKLCHPWVAGIGVLLVVLVISGVVYRHHSFRATVERYPSWVLATKDELTNNSSGTAAKLSFRANGRLYANQDSDGDKLTDALAAKVEDSGTWHGDHKTVTANLQSTDSSTTTKLVFTRLSKFSTTFNGIKFNGYQVRMDMSESGDHESENLYLIHN